MPLDPKTAQKLTADIPELRELIMFLSEEALKLDKVSDVKIEDPVAFAVEVKARQRAFETVTEMLAPLVDTRELSRGINNKDYVA